MIEMARTYYTEDHEWIRLEGDVARVGITQYAQQQLGDLVFVELPEPGRSVSKGEAIAVVESVKAASDVYAPLDGEIVAVNEDLAEKPGLVNEDPEGKGWLWTMRLTDASALENLLNADDYARIIA
jgi:glycine cleavage system H protein